MTQGLQIFDASGRLITDVTTRLGKVMGSAAVSGNGSVTLPDLQGNQPWFLFKPSSVTPNYPLDCVLPEFTISGNTISWTYTVSPYATSPAYIYGTISYGVF